VREVARLAQLEADVDGFPLGFATPLGERGVTLSGGQRQRTAIARAIIRDPSVLIFDDALSAVDTQTEANILEGLRRVQQGRTTIVVAHRVSAFQHCDRVLVFDEGRLVESGTPTSWWRRMGGTPTSCVGSSSNRTWRRHDDPTPRPTPASAAAGTGPGGGMTTTPRERRRPLADPTIGGMVDPDYDVERAKAAFRARRKRTRAAMREEGTRDEDGEKMEAAFDRGLARRLLAYLDPYRGP
jgi:ABC-type multidrug transport system ATPase subunit